MAAEVVGPVNASRALATLVGVMTGVNRPPAQVSHVAAYAWLSQAVKQFLDGDLTRDELAADLSTCETALLQVGSR